MNDHSRSLLVAFTVLPCLLAPLAEGCSDAPTVQGGVLDGAASGDAMNPGDSFAPAANVDAGSEIDADGQVDAGGDPQPDANTADAANDGEASDASSDAGGDAAVDAAPPPDPIEVSGTLFAPFFDEPLVGASVTVNGDTATTSASGKFGPLNAVVPYDLDVSFVVSNAKVPIFDRWRGLTKKTPTLEGAYPTLNPSQSAKIEGSLTGIGPTIPVGKVARVFARSTFGSVVSQVLNAGAAPTYSLQPKWFGSTDRDIVVHALVEESSGAYPTAFSEYGTTKFTAKNGSTEKGDIALVSLLETKLVGTITPANFVGTLSTQLRFGNSSIDGSVISWSSPATSPFKQLAPAAPSGAILYAQASRSYPSGAQLNARAAEAPGGASLDLVDVGEPVLSTPIGGATFSAGMTFSWSPPPNSKGGAYLFRFGPQGSSLAPLWKEHTGTTSVTLPASFVPASKMTYSWSVIFFPGATVDDLAGEDLGTLRTHAISAQRTVTIP